MSTKAIGRSVGALFLLAFVAYGVGNALVGSGTTEVGALASKALRTRLTTARAKAIGGIVPRADSGSTSITIRRPEYSGRTVRRSTSA